MALADLDGRFIEVNRALCQLLGYAEPQLLRATIGAITHPHDVEGMLDGTRLLLAGETTRFQAEQRYLHADGFAGWALVSISLINDASGRPRYFVVGMDDIISRQKVERLRAIPITMTRLLADATASADAPRGILQKLCQDLGWDVGQLWISDGEEDVLRVRDFCSALAPEAANAQGINPESSLFAEIDLPGRIWRSREPVWVVDLTQDPDFVPTAALPALHGAFGFPILNGGKVTGVVNFYSREICHPDRGLLTMVTDIGSQIGQFIER